MSSAPLLQAELRILTSAVSQDHVLPLPALLSHVQITFRLPNQRSGAPTHTACSVMLLAAPAIHKCCSNCSLSSPAHWYHTVAHTHTSGGDCVFQPFACPHALLVCLP